MNGYLGLFQYFKNAEMGKALGRTASQGQTYFRYH